MAVAQSSGPVPVAGALPLGPGVAGAEVGAAVCCAGGGFVVVVAAAGVPVAG